MDNYKKIKNVVALFFVGTVCFADVASAEILVGWHNFPDDNKPYAADITNYNASGSATSQLGDPQRDSSSTDGTYGSTGGAVGNTLTNGSLAIKQTSAARITVTAGTKQITLEKLHFDFKGGSGSVPNSVLVTYLDGDLDDPDGTVIGTYGPTTTWADYDVELSGALTDIILAPGESARFQFKKSGAGNLATTIDNIAITFKARGTLLVIK